MIYSNIISNIYYFRFLSVQSSNIYKISYVSIIEYLVIANLLFRRWEIGNFINKKITNSIIIFVFKKNKIYYFSCKIKGKSL